MKFAPCSPALRILVLAAIGLGPKGLADDRFFPVTSKAKQGGTSLGTPSVNESGDVVFRLINGSQRSIKVIPGADQKTATESSMLAGRVVRTSTGTLSTFPVINASGSVCTYNFVSSLQLIQRYDAPPNATAIARSEPSQTPPNPYSFLSPIAGLDDTGQVHFYGERTPLNQSNLLKAIYRSATEVTTPALVTPVASSTDFSSIDPYVSCSANGNFTVWRGISTGGPGIYLSGGHPGAKDSAGFSNTGVRPSVNNAGVLALSATYTPPGGAARDGVFLRFNNDAVLRAGSALTGASRLEPQGEMPASYTPASADRVGLNEYGQVLFIALDEDGNRTLYSTTLGPCRALISVGDTVTFEGSAKVVSAISLFDGLKKNGQAFFWISTTSGEEFIVRAPRGYLQKKLALQDGPFTASYGDTKYLLRSIPSEEAKLKPKAHPTVGDLGCNLTSTANILTAYGHDVTPGELQQWLLARYLNPPEGRSKSDYISAKENDFVDSVVLLYSQESKALSSPQAPALRFLGVHNASAAGAMTNLEKLASELRAGYPVKLRVPNGSTGSDYNPWGHYVLAYGVKDPGKTGPLVAADILIHDPGHSGIETLADYGSKLPQRFTTKYDSKGDWLEDKVGGSRLYLYRPLPPASTILDSIDFMLGVRPTVLAGLGPKNVPGSRVYFMITDAMGRRLGTGPDGTEYSEIPDSEFYVSQPFTSLGDGDDSYEGAGEFDTATYHLNLRTLPAGNCSLTITAVDAIDYDTSAAGTGSAVPPAGQSGTLAAGQSTTIQIGGGTLPSPTVPQLAIKRTATDSALLSIHGSTGTNYQLRSSTDLGFWIDVGTPRAGADVVIEWTVPISPTTSGRVFYRVEMSGQ